MSITNKSLVIRAFGPANLFSLSTHIYDFLAEVGGDGWLQLHSVGSTGALVGLPDNDEIRRAFISWIMEFMPYTADHRHPGNAFAHLRSTVFKCALGLPVRGRRPCGLTPHLLENTSGRKSRPIILTWLNGGGKDKNVHRREFSVNGEGWIDMVDITGSVMEIAAQAGVTEGQVFVSALDPKAAIITTENEMRLVLDTADLFAKLLQDGSAFDRQTAGHFGPALLGQSLAAPIVDGRLGLGTWQQLMLADFGAAGEKKILVDVIGDPKK